MQGSIEANSFWEEPEGVACVVLDLNLHEFLGDDYMIHGLCLGMSMFGSLVLGRESRRELEGKSCSVCFWHLLAFLVGWCEVWYVWIPAGLNSCRHLNKMGLGGSGCCWHPCVQSRRLEGRVGCGNAILLTWPWLMRVRHDRLWGFGDLARNRVRWRALTPATGTFERKNFTLFASASIASSLTGARFQMYYVRWLMASACSQSNLIRLE